MSNAVAEKLDAVESLPEIKTLEENLRKLSVLELENKKKLEAQKAERDSLISTIVNREAEVRLNGGEAKSIVELKKQARDLRDEIELSERLSAEGLEAKKNELLENAAKVKREEFLALVEKELAEFRQRRQSWHALRQEFFFGMRDYFSAWSGLENLVHFGARKFLGETSATFDAFEPLPGDELVTDVSPDYLDKEIFSLFEGRENGYMTLERVLLVLSGARRFLDRT